MKAKRFPVQKQLSRNGFTAWIQPQMEKHLMQCCDCGLVHELQFRVAGERVQFRARRAIGHTARERKRLASKGKPT